MSTRTLRSLDSLNTTLLAEIVVQGELFTFHKITLEILAKYCYHRRKLRIDALGQIKEYLTQDKETETLLSAASLNTDDIDKLSRDTLGIAYVVDLCFEKANPAETTKPSSTLTFLEMMRVYIELAAMSGLLVTRPLGKGVLDPQTAQEEAAPETGSTSTPSSPPITPD